MKVLLVRPRPHKETIGLQHVMICEPLELEYLVSNIPDFIKKSIDIKIVDMILEKIPYESVLLKEKPDFILFTGYITHVGIIKKLAEQAKGLLPEISTGVGGVHAEVVPEDFKCRYIDFVFDRNGIDGFNEALKALLEGKSKSDIRKMLKDSGPKKYSFSYKHPAREAVSQYRKHYYYMFHKPCALIKTSFGCPYNCQFCFCREITDGKYFARAVEDVINELEAIKEEEIYIVDDDFLYDADRVVAFIAAIRERNIKKRFLVYGRADFIVENEGLLKEFKDCGLQAVIVGIESIRSKDLDDYRKGTTKQINEKCIEILKSMDIELYATLIIPLDFSKKDFKELTAWLKALEVRFVNLQPLTPLPGTDIFDMYLPELLIRREDYHLWDMAHIALKPKHMSISEFYLQLLTSYYKVIMRPKHMAALIKKYGIRANIKMLIGSSFVSWQYLQKIWRGK